MFKKSKGLGIALLAGMVFAVSVSLQAPLLGAEKTTLRFFMAEDPISKGKFRIGFDEYEKDYPNIEVKIETVPYAQLHDKQLIMVEAGKTPDFGIAEMGLAYSLFKSGGFLALDDYFAQSDVAKPDDFFEGPWGTMYVDGKIRGMPWESDCRLVYYNIDMFDNAGLSQPTHGTRTDFTNVNWKQMLDIWKKLTIDTDGSGIVDQFGFGFVGGEYDHFLHDGADFYHQVDGKIVDSTASYATVNEEPFVRFVQFYVDMVEEKVVPPGYLSYMSYDDTRAMFAEEKMATWVVGPWEYGILDAMNPDLNYDVTDLPLAEGGYLASSGGGWHISIYAAAEHPDEAWRGMEYLIKYTMPASLPCQWSKQILKAQMEPRLKIFFEYLPYTKSPSVPFTEITEVWKITHRKIQEALLGQKTAQEAMDEAAKMINKVLGYKG